MDFRRFSHLFLNPPAFSAHSAVRAWSTAPTDKMPCSCGNTNRYWSDGPHRIGLGCPFARALSINRFTPLVFAPAESRRLQLSCFAICRVGILVADVGHQFCLFNSRDESPTRTLFRGCCIARCSIVIIIIIIIFSIVIFLGPLWWRFAKINDIVRELGIARRSLVGSIKQEKLILKHRAISPLHGVQLGRWSARHGSLVCLCSTAN
jgi:hypothetical protein